MAKPYTTNDQSPARLAYNLSEAARAVGVSPATLCGYRGDKEKLKNGSARTVARIAKFRRLSMEEKARLMDELAE